MRRSYAVCPECQCYTYWALNVPTGSSVRTGNLAWKGDEDPGLIIAYHIEQAHPTLLYGDIIPANLYRKMMEALRT